MVIVTPILPTILKLKKHSETQDYQRLQALYGMMIIISVSGALLMTFCDTTD